MSNPEDRPGSETGAPRRRGRPPNPPKPPKPPQALVPTRAERLAEAIADAIFAGTFLPGVHLDEHTLADRFKVSRTPVRDAIRLLHGSGLVEMRPQRGVRVRTLSPEEIAGLFTAMGEVEASCARLSALCMSEGERTQIQSLHAQMGDLAASGDQPAYVEANRSFHGLLYAGAHNAPLSEMAVSLRRRLTPYRTAQFRLSGRLSLSHVEHGRVLRAVLARDGSTANTTMLAHMSVVGDAFEAQDAGQAEGRAAGRSPPEPGARMPDARHGAARTKG